MNYKTNDSTQSKRLAKMRNERIMNYMASKDCRSNEALNTFHAKPYYMRSKSSNN